MKFLASLLLVVASVHSNSLPYNGLAPGQEMVFKYQSQVLTRSAGRVNCSPLIMPFMEPEDGIFWTSVMQELPDHATLHQAEVC